MSLVIFFNDLRRIILMRERERKRKFKWTNLVKNYSRCDSVCEYLTTNEFGIHWNCVDWNFNIIPNGTLWTCEPQCHATHLHIKYVTTICLCRFGKYYINWVNTHLVHYVRRRSVLYCYLWENVCMDWMAN